VNKFNFEWLMLHAKHVEKVIFLVYRQGIIICDAKLLRTSLLPLTTLLDPCSDHEARWKYLGGNSV
jgi:hypothetical protein